MRYLKYAVLFFILALVVKANYSQSYYNVQLTVEDGLAQADVLSLHQDQLGNLWIGSNGGGITIYNGRSFSVLSKEDGLVDNVVFAITQDHNNNFWFGTNDGVSFYANGKFKNFTKEDGLPHSRVYDVIEKNDTVWCGTEKGLAYIWNDSVYPYTENEILSDAFIFKVFIDSEDNFWFGTYGRGVIKWCKSGEFVRYTTNNNLYNNLIRSIVEDKQHNIWVGTWEGTNIIKKDTIEKLPKRKSLTETVGSLLACKNGDILKVDYSKWVTRYNKDLEILYKKYFSGYIFWSSLEDREGNIWIGTLGKGLIKVSDPLFINYNVENDSLYNNNIYAIYKTMSGDYLVGAKAQGMVKISVGMYNRISVKRISHDKRNKLRFKGSSITSIVQQKDSTIWVGTNNGLTMINRHDTINYLNMSDTTDKYKISYEKNLTHNKIQSLFIDSKNTLWLGTNNGVTIYRDSAFINYNEIVPRLENEIIWSILEGQDGEMWFTTDYGAFSVKGKEVNYYDDKAGFTSDRVRSVVQGPDGNFWFGTNSGVFFYNGKKFQKINRDSGLMSNNIYSVVFDDHNNLFIGSNKGIEKLNVNKYIETGEVEVRSYSSLEGFMGQECNSNAVMKDEDGKIWFGTVNGITIYDPRYDKLNATPPVPVIENIKLAYKDVDWTEFSDGIDNKTGLPVNLVLPYNKNHLTFNYIAASLSIQEKVKYQYKLEGLSTEWSPELSKVEADYPSLPPGDYTFRVKAANNDGVWSDEPAELSFVIKPPFWQTWWFYTIIAGISLLLIYAYTKYREAALKREKERLERIVEERTAEIKTQKEIVEQKNKDITDSINYAKNIQNAILPNLEDIKQRYPESFVLFKPRDIVSGDFYWFNQTEKAALFAAADCTGHGVPGAFMSILGVTFLNEIVNKDKVERADKILNNLRQEVIRALNQDGKVGQTKDGMDIVVISIDREKKKLQFAGANNPLLLVRKKDLPGFDSDKLMETQEHFLYEFKGDKMPIAYHLKMEPFKNNEIDLLEGDVLYFFSDGFQDQFGGPADKKFKVKKFKELILSIQDKSMDQQKEILNNTIESWRKYRLDEGIEVEQIDDILVMGVKV